MSIQLSLNGIKMMDNSMVWVQNMTVGYWRRKTASLYRLILYQFVHLALEVILLTLRGCDKGCMCRSMRVSWAVFLVRSNSLILRLTWVLSQEMNRHCVYSRKGELQT